jgi:hydroxyacylglutathione hydrolase
VTLEDAGRPAAGAMLEVHALQLGPIGTNCYVVHEPGAHACFVVDPGAEAERVLELVEAEGLTIEAILVTHFHYDHTGGVAALAAATGAPVWMSADEAYGLEQPEQFADQWATMASVPAWPVEHRLAGGERIEIAGIALDVLLLPGHSPAHIAFIADGARDEDGVLTPDPDRPPLAFSGDVLFRGSIGRTDLPGADHAVMVRSLTQMVRRLDPTTLVLSGHGPVTSMEAEIRTNPVLAGI